MNTKLKGIILLLITAMAWGSGFAARKLGSAAIPPISFNGLRLIGASIVLLPIAIAGLKKSGYLSKSALSYHEYETHKHRVIVGGIVCGICMTVGSTLQSMGLATVSAGKSGFITSLYVVITPIFAVLFGQKIRRKTWLCIVVAVAGFALLSLHEGLGNIHIGDLELLGCAAGFAAQIIAIGKYVDKGNDLLLSVIQMGLCGVLEMIYAIPFEQPTVSQLVACAPALLYSILIPSALGYTLQVVGQKYAESTASALILSLESVFSAIFGAIVLGEMMATRELAGCVLIFAAVVFNQIDFRDFRKK